MKINILLKIFIIILKKKQYYKPLYYSAYEVDNIFINTYKKYLIFDIEY
jgi:hypothetical protein